MGGGVLVGKMNIYGLTGRERNGEGGGKMNGKIMNTGAKHLHCISEGGKE
jgi:hypothetical protein